MEALCVLHSSLLSPVQRHPTPCSGQDGRKCATGSFPTSWAAKHYSLFCTLITCLLLNMFPCAESLLWNRLCSQQWASCVLIRTHFDTLHTLYRFAGHLLQYSYSELSCLPAVKGFFSSHFCNVTVNRCDWRQWDLWLNSELIQKRKEKQKMDAEQMRHSRDQFCSHSVLFLSSTALFKNS